MKKKKKILKFIKMSSNSFTFLYLNKDYFYSFNIYYHKIIYNNSEIINYLFKENYIKNDNENDIIFF